MTDPTVRTRALQDARLLRASLAAVWLITAAVSAVEAGGRGAALLAAAGVHSPLVANLLLWGGVALDMVVGLALCFAPPRAGATLALASTLVMTIVATVLLPSLWLDPLGPLSKNLPILAALLVLRRRTP
jgi:hypothetical protein